MLTAFYGPESPQVTQFQAGCEAIEKSTSGREFELWAHAIGAIRNTKAEIEAGLIIRVRVAVAGEVLEELVRLAREILADKTEEAKNVGAVLVAAAYEDLIRRMGAEFAGVAGRPKLEEIITALKGADVLKGGQVGTAQSYLKFRNDSLHADWKIVDCSQIESCLAFIESLLLKHCS